MNQHHRIQNTIYATRNQRHAVPDKVMYQGIEMKRIDFSTIFEGNERGVEDNKKFEKNSFQLDQIDTILI